MCFHLLYRDGDVPASAAVLGDNLRGVERMQRHQCLWAGRDTDEVGDDLQSQLRNVPVRGEHLHPGAGGVYGHPTPSAAAPGGLRDSGPLWRV